MNTLVSLVQHARQHSPYYAQLYRDVPQTDWRLHELPLVQSQQYWQMHGGLKAWPVLTGTVDDAHIFKTGGTTGSGKVSVYTRQEWRAFVTTFGQGISSLLQPGDRIANLFFAGDLYASFLFIHGSLAHMDLPVCEYPFTGAVDPDALIDGVRFHDINVLAGVPAQLLRFAGHLQQKGEQLPQIRTILYGGESVFAEQLDLLRSAFPNAQCRSIGCASVDAGLLGASTPDCALGEHRSFDGDAIVEIIDEVTGEPIDDVGRSGMLVLTNLQRKLMPLIRYPVGDMAAWVEEAGTPQRKFVLQGRSSLGHRVRVGTVGIFPDDIEASIRDYVGPCSWQLIIDREAGADHMIVRMAHAAVDGTARDALYAALVTKHPGLATLITAGQLRLSLAWCNAAELTLHPRTGKLQRVVDKRDYQAVAEEAKA